ncbi:hypothetical protein CTA2_1095 [Colletotrichum tanaceti]|nr:hypothetical protein CTA2_1095 [Colletotrichum tanaceti]
MNYRPGARGNKFRGGDGWLMIPSRWVDLAIFWNAGEEMPRIGATRVSRKETLACTRGHYVTLALSQIKGRHGHRNAPGGGNPRVESIHRPGRLPRPGGRRWRRNYAV